MNINLSVTVFVIGAALLAASFVFRKKQFAPKLRSVAAALLFIGFILIMWWGAARFIGFK